MTVQEIQTMIRQNMVLYRNVAKPLTDKEADLLIATWADALSDVPSAAGKLAFRRALRVCHFPVLIADLYDQLRAMQMESEPKAADLWQLVCERAHKANENKGLYSFTGHLPDGRTQGQAARDANKRLFDELPPAVQEYFGSLQALVDLDAETASGKSIRRRDFEKFYADWQKQQPFDPQKLPCAAAGPALNGIAQKVVLD